MKVYNVYKPLGKTPLEALESLRKKLKIKESVSLTYAGRLDPMAEGVLIILSGVTQKQKEKFLALPKSYEAEVLFGFSTDSFDVLGLPKKHKGILPVKNQIKQRLIQYLGSVNLQLPVYSSPLVKGIPLHMWARSGMIKSIEVPCREMIISKISHLRFKKYSGINLLSIFEKKISKVSGDFRQEKVIKNWQKILLGNKKYISVKFIVDCQSGPYIRSLADDLGKKIVTGAMLFGLKRLSVGNYKLVNSVKLK